MDPTVILYLIIALILFMILTVAAYVLYSGLFYEIQVGAGKPPMGNVVVAYKFTRGPYRGAGELFTEVTCLAPQLRPIGVYYDDPKQVPQHKLRYIVGCILAEGTEEPDQGLQEALTMSGYKLVTFPMVTNVVKTRFPYNTTLSILLAVYRVYPRIGTYVTEQRLCAHPMIEIYEGSSILFMAPLSKQDEFYVPETTGMCADHNQGDVSRKSREPSTYGAKDMPVRDKTSTKESLSEPANGKQDASPELEQGNADQSKSTLLTLRTMPILVTTPPTPGPDSPTGEAPSVIEEAEAQKETTNQDSSTVSEDQNAKEDMSASMGSDTVDQPITGPNVAAASQATAAEVTSGGQTAGHSEFSADSGSESSFEELKLEGVEDAK